jgi:hypothetical protein
MDLDNYGRGDLSKVFVDCLRGGLGDGDLPKLLNFYRATRPTCGARWRASSWMTPSSRTRKSRHSGRRLEILRPGRVLHLRIAEHEARLLSSALCSVCSARCCPTVRGSSAPGGICRRILISSSGTESVRGRAVKHLRKLPSQKTLFLPIRSPPAFLSR